MQGVYLIVFEVFIIIFYGIFVRTSTTDTNLTSYISSIASGFYFLLAYTATSFRYKMFDWSLLSNMLFILIICLQLNTLYVMFWQSCFDGFYQTSNFSSIHVITALQGALAIMITNFEFIGQMNKVQLFVLSMVEVFAFALNWTVEFKGIKAMTGGSIMTTFLFGYVFSLPIRKIKFTEPLFEEEKQKYFTLTLKFIGLVILIFLWPSWNVMTSIPDMSLTNILSTALLMQEAYLQTFLGLLSAVITTLSVRIYGEKIIINQFVNSIINTGILIGASASVIIDPFASILLGVMGPIIYLLYEKYFTSEDLKRYPLDKILMCLVAATLNSIFVAGRDNRTPSLAYSHSSQAGYQFANFVVSGSFALFFGFLAAIILKNIKGSTDENSNKDSSVWLIEQQIMPLYCDDGLISKFYQKQNEKKVKKQQDAYNLKQSYLQQKARENVQLGKVLKQQIQYESRIK